MRIAYVFDQLLPLAAADTEQVVSTVSSLGACGVEIELVIPRARNAEIPTAESLARFFDVEPTFTVTTLASTYPAPRGIEKVGHAMVGVLAEATRGADIVYTRNLPVLLGLLASRPTRASGLVVYEHYRPWPSQFWAMKLLFRGLARLPNAPAMILHSELASRAYLACGFDPARMLVAHNGWDPALMEPRLDRDAARAAVGIDHRGPLVLYSGRVGEGKGLDTLVRLAAGFPEAKFLFVGSLGQGPIEALAASVPNVEFRPWCSRRELAPYLYAADVLAVPPSSGPLERAGTTVLPLKTFIYLGAGRAIFAADTPDVRELLVDGVNARLVAPDDDRAAHDAMAELLGDAALRERLATASRSTAEALTWRARGRRVAEFLATL